MKSPGELHGERQTPRISAAFLVALAFLRLSVRFDGTVHAPPKEEAEPTRGDEPA